jgi:low affinity Fe/Cu permease
MINCYPMHNALASHWAHRLAHPDFRLAQPQPQSSAARCGDMSEQPKRGRFYRLGARVSSTVSDFSAHPFVQAGLILFCVAWFLSGWPVDILTAGLSILAISLTQMVLNRQNERELEAHRRDVAMHAKLDELVIASRRARDAMAGIEELDEDVIVEMREHADEAREEAEAAVAERRKRPKA